jgi:hypothetical protein
MHPSGSCKCLHCGELFRPDARNRGRQRYCRAPGCQKASKAASQRAWLSKRGNEDYFRGAYNAARVRAWQAAHPGYWKKRRRKGAGTLQEASPAQSADTQKVAGADGEGVLQDLLTLQAPVVVGLIAHLTGSVLQEDIAAIARHLHSRGRAVMGIDVRRSDHDHAKTHHRFAAGAARAAPV